MSRHTLGGYALTILGYVLGALFLGIGAGAIGALFDHGGGILPSMTFMLSGAVIGAFVGSISGCWLVLEVCGYPAARSTALRCAGCFLGLVFVFALPIRGELFGPLIVSILVLGCVAARWLAMAQRRS